MKTNHVLHCLLLNMLLCLSAYAQKTVDYSTSNLPTQLCNVFNTSTPATINGITHYPVAGGVSFSGSHLALGTKFSSSFSTNLGTAYALAYQFKAGYAYSIKITAARVSDDPVSNPQLTVSVFPSLPDPTITQPTACGPVGQDKWIGLQQNVIYGTYINANMQTYTIPTWTPTTSMNYMIVLASQGSSTAATNVLISKIDIAEAAAQFTLSPTSTSTTCGQQTPVTYTVNNPSNIPGVTGYEWNLGGNSNGWLYGGLPAPATIFSTQSSLTLTSTGTAKPNDVSVVVHVNNAPYGAYSSAVSMSFPDLRINGPDIICNSSVYTVNNLPNGANVAWSIPQSGSVLQLSHNSPGPNQLTITNKKWYSLTTTLTANIQLCGNAVTQSKTIINDNDSSTQQAGYVTQDGCHVYNKYYPGWSGQYVYPTFLNAYCMTRVSQVDVSFGKRIILDSGSGQPVHWHYSFFERTLYLQMAASSSPVTFLITGNGACADKRMLFFTKSGTGFP